MKTKSGLQQPITFRPVYLSDLQPIREVYREHETACGIKDTQTIGMDFGIPLNLAEQNGKVLAYSFLNVTDKQEVRLHVFVDKDYPEAEIKKKLEAYSKSGNTNAYIDGKPDQQFDVRNVDYAVRTLVDWLNSCLS